MVRGVRGVTRYIGKLPGGKFADAIPGVLDTAVNAETRDEKAEGYGGAAGGMAGAWAGASVGAAIGSVVPVIGTAIGGAIGMAIGGIGGEALGGWLSKKLFGEDKPEAVAEAPERYDRAHTFFYMDPPYWQTAGYGVDFPFEEYERMADFMRRCKGKVMVSINDHPDIRRAFDGFHFEHLDIRYTNTNQRQGKSEVTGELVIMNWQPSSLGGLF